MMGENVVLCGANSYNRKYYLNPLFSKLPEEIQRELKIMCVTIVAKSGGILTLEFDPDGELQFRVQCAERDYEFDDIASGMEISHARVSHQELLEEIQLYWRVLRERNSR